MTRFVNCIHYVLMYNILPQNLTAENSTHSLSHTGFKGQEFGSASSGPLMRLLQSPQG